MLCFACRTTSQLLLAKHKSKAMNKVTNCLELLRKSHAKIPASTSLRISWQLWHVVVNETDAVAVKATTVRMEAKCIINARGN